MIQFLAPALTSEQVGVSYTEASGIWLEEDGILLLQDSLVAFNSGGIYLTGTSTLTATGAISINDDITINSGSFFAPDDTGSLSIGGNLINKDTFAHNNGTVTFNGAGMQTITGDTVFNNVVVGDGVTLTTSSFVTVAGMLTNSGWTSETLELAGVPPFTQTFGLADISVGVIQSGALDRLQVIRRDRNHPDATVGNPPTSTLQTGKFWTIVPNAGVNDTFSVTLTLPHNNVNTPQVCKWPGELGGDGWDCAADGSTTGTTWRTGISHFTDWAVGAHTGPTAIALHEVSAHSGSNVIGLIVLLAIASGLAGLTLSIKLWRNKLWRNKLRRSVNR